MTTRILALVIALLWMVPLFAQDPAADPRNAKPTWESYSRSPKASRLGFELRMIAAKEHPAPAPAEFVQLIAQGLSDGAPDSQQGALSAIASYSGVLHPPTPASFAMWQTYRDVMVGFRKQVEGLLLDQDQNTRHAALVAFGALNTRPGENAWVMDFDEAAMQTWSEVFHRDPSAIMRSEVVKLAWMCKCRDSVGEKRKQLLREAIYDTDAGVLQYAIRGAADLKISDMLDSVVRLLKHEDDGLRQNAATAVAMFGPEARRYDSEIREALAKETREEVRSLLRSTLPVE